MLKNIPHYFFLSPNSYFLSANQSGVVCPLFYFSYLFDDFLLSNSPLGFFNLDFLSPAFGDIFGFFPDAGDCFYLPDPDTNFNFSSSYSLFLCSSYGFFIGSGDGYDYKNCSCYPISILISFIETNASSFCSSFPLYIFERRFSYLSLTSSGEGDDDSC